MCQQIPADKIMLLGEADHEFISAQIMSLVVMIEDCVLSKNEIKGLKRFMVD
jgi:hypothetical protein